MTIALGCETRPSWGSLSNPDGKIRFLIATEAYAAWWHAHRSSYRSRIAYIDWAPNTESDLAGYHVEMAGSVDGPWIRVTDRPIAWWETHYDARLWLPDAEDIVPGSDWVGPDCAVFQVIAVDEYGNESPPSAKFQVAPFPERNDYDLNTEYTEQACSESGETLSAPQNLDAETVPAPSFPTQYATRLTWDRDSAADEYRVYRLSLYHPGQQFYVTGIVDDEGQGCDSSTCEFLENGDDNSPGYYCPFSNQCELGHLDAFFVTAVEQADPGEMPRESPRSNIVLWDVFDQYVYNVTEDELWDALASIEHERNDEPPWCEDARDPYCDGGLGSIVAHSALVDVPATTPLLAPLLTLGQTQPPFEIYNLHVDHLGSTRVVTDENGDQVSYHDFFPFGETIASVFDYNTKMFTGHERDEETGLDYMLARYYGANLGRLLSVDPLPDSADPMSPQSWNRYAYVLNNPMVFIDPTGLCTVDPESGPGGDCVTGIVVDNSDATVTVEYGDGEKEEHPAAVGDPSSPEATEEAEGTVTGTAWGPVSNLYESTQESYNEDTNPDNPYGPAIILVEGTDGRHIHGTTGPINDDTAALGGDSPEGRRFTAGCARVCNTTIIDLKADVDRTLAEKVTIKVRFQE